MEDGAYYLGDDNGPNFTTDTSLTVMATGVMQSSEV